jgi:hypothetical protein
VRLHQADEYSPPLVSDDRHARDQDAIEPGAVRFVGRIDAVRLNTEHPSPVSNEAHWAALRGDLSWAYNGYVAEVSTAGMAASLETGTYLYLLCRAARATSVLDLGEGSVPTCCAGTLKTLRTPSQLHPSMTMHGGSGRRLTSYTNRTATWKGWLSGRAMSEVSSLRRWTLDSIGRRAVLGVASLFQSDPQSDVTHSVWRAESSKMPSQRNMPIWLDSVLESGVVYRVAGQCVGPTRPT